MGDMELEDSLDQVERQRLAAILLRGHGHPSLPQVVFFQVEGDKKADELSQMVLERGQRLTIQGLHPAITPPGTLHQVDVRGGAGGCIHWFPPLSPEEGAELTQGLCQRFDNLSLQISTLHLIESKDGAPMKLPWIYAVDVVGVRVEE